MGLGGTVDASQASIPLSPSRAASESARTRLGGNAQLQPSWAGRCLPAALVCFAVSAPATFLQRDGTDPDWTELEPGRVQTHGHGVGDAVARSITSPFSGLPALLNVQLRESGLPPQNGIWQPGLLLGLT